MEIDPEVIRALQERGIEPPEEQLGGGITAFATWASAEWVIQHRDRRSLYPLIELSRWAAPARERDDLLAGTETEVLYQGPISFWSLSPRLDTPESADRFRSLSRNQRFRLSWPDMLETMRALEVFALQSPPPPGVGRSPNNKGTLIEECSNAQKRALLRQYGIDPLEIPGAPGDCPEGRIGLFHGDLSRRNMVDSGRGRYRAIDWEMCALHPVGVEVTHSLVTQFVDLPDINEWHRLIDFALPGMCEISDLEPREMLRTLFWGTVAGFVVAAPSAEEDFRAYLPEGLALIAELAQTS